MESGEQRRDPAREPVSVPRSQVTTKTVLTICSAVLGFLALIYLLWHSVLTLTLTVVAALLAVALQHAVERLQSWGVTRRPVAIGLTLVLVFGLIAGLFFLLIPLTVEQVRQLVDRLPEYVERVRASAAFRWADARMGLEERLSRLGGSNGLLQKATEPALRALGNVLKGVGTVITVLVLAIFMLLYGGRLVRGLLAEALPEHRERYERVLGKAYRSVGGYLSGLAFIALINATLASLFLAILRVPYFLPLGILSGLGSLIPLVGATAAGVLLSLVALATGGVSDGALTALYITLYQQFENHVLGPLVYQRTVKLNPLVMLLGVILFADLAGLVGALIAVPVVGAGQIVLRELLLLRREHLHLPLTGDVAEQVRREPRRFWRRPRRA
ncbi:MAG: AI-2E family transporter [Myxococcaceae bacterium]|nr:AI-2E family transporter [Myxococcaceae bacterium]